MFSIAIADDEERIRLGISKVLGENLTGIEIVPPFESGGALLEYLKAHPVDLLITDIEMSGASGLKILETLRREGRSTRVVIITAFQRFDYAMSALEHHADAFLTKPFSTQKLLETVRGQLAALQQEADSRSGQAAHTRELLRLICGTEQALPETLFLLGETRPLDETPCELLLLEIVGWEAASMEHRAALDAELTALSTLGTDEALCVPIEKRGGLWQLLLFAAPGFDRAQFLRILEDAPRRVCGLSAEITAIGCECLAQLLLTRRFVRETTAYEGATDGRAVERLHAFARGLTTEEAAAFAHYLRGQEGLPVEGDTAEACLRALENGHEQPRDGSLAGKARCMIDERYADPLLSLGQVADELGVSAAYLSRQFKRTQGVNYSEYCQSLRLRHACRLLESTELPINAVAEAVGYQRGNTVYFRTTFKAVYGVTPRQYRETHNAEARS